MTQKNENDVLSKQINNLAFEGQWESLLQLLERYPSLISVASESKGYTPLHQAAWHSAECSVIEQAADKTLTIYNKRQASSDIATEKIPARKDLFFLLHPLPRTLTQLMRKMIEDQLVVFESCDENIVIYERLLFIFNEYGISDFIANDENRFLSDSWL